MADPVIKYTGKDGEYHSGIPMRDLSGPEFDALDAEQRAVVRASPVYDYATYRDAVKKQRDRADAKAAKEASVTEAPAADVPATDANQESAIAGDERPS